MHELKFGLTAPAQCSYLPQQQEQLVQPRPEISHSALAQMRQMVREAAMAVSHRFQQQDHLDTETYLDTIMEILDEDTLVDIAEGEQCGAEDFVSHVHSMVLELIDDSGNAIWHTV